MRIIFIEEQGFVDQIKNLTAVHNSRQPTAFSHKTRTHNVVLLSVCQMQEGHGPNKGTY